MSMIFKLKQKPSSSPRLRVPASLRANYITNITETNIDACENAESFLQSALWGEFKSRFGWESRAFLIDWKYEAGQETLPLLILCRRLAPSLSFAYVPWGPQLPQDFPETDKGFAITELAKKLKPFLQRNTAFIRFDPPWFVEEDAQAIGNEENAAAAPAPFAESFLACGFRQAAAAVQPPDTVIVDLAADCEEILKLMKPKWRYNISLAQKKGIQVKKGGAYELESFYNLLKETAARDGIAIHSFDYYKTLFEICGRENKSRNDTELRLYTASHESDILAAIVVLFRGKWATYLYGASSNVKRNLMSTYALQWQAMQDAKEAGCIYYDLFGIPPNDDPNHPMAGLYRFKTGFGGRIIHRPGSWDFPYKPVVYSLFNFAERLRKIMRDKKKKR